MTSELKQCKYDGHNPIQIQSKSNATYTMTPDLSCTVTRKRLAVVTDITKHFEDAGKRRMSTADV